LHAELLRCDYAARRSRSGCRRYRATVIVRYLDNQGRALRQVEMCHKNARLAAETRVERTVRDLRKS
jgi:hypothetical protein